MKLLLQFVRYMEACVTSPDWLDKFHSFFSASFLLAKESETFIFLGIFCNLLVQSLLNFKSRVGWLLCENNQKWPKAKHCFDNFDSSDTLRAPILKNICKRLLLKMSSWNWEKRLFIRNFYIYIKETSENVCLNFMKETSEMLVFISWLVSFGVCIQTQYFCDVRLFPE